jgi:CDP-paratose 2-epimerase
MGCVIVTGSAGLIGGETVRRFCREGFDVHGIDNDLRAQFFGDDASTQQNAGLLSSEYASYHHHAIDIRDNAVLESVFQECAGDIDLVVHAAAQPSHDWAARDPQTDFSINAVGTLNLLECARRHAPHAPFLFTSTNKVYGDAPNALPFVELETRWELDPANPYAEHGIDETMSIDQCKHSIFGASKVAADIMVQEYGRYFGMKTVCFRAGCVTGPSHAGAELHGFLAYLMRCAVTGNDYRIYGYGGKQVRDNIHAADFAEAFWQVFQDPRSGEVYNIGGGRHSNCSVLEAIAFCEEITGRKLNATSIDQPRSGDHRWWISDTRRFQLHYPGWQLTHDLPAIFTEIHDSLKARV